MPGTCNEKSEKELIQKLKSSHRELAQAKARISKLDTIVQHIYEDKLDDKLSDERFKSMTKSYDKEQAELTSKINPLKPLFLKRKKNVST